MNRKILVIDDDVIIQNLLVEHLSNEHTQVQSASDGESGVALARQCKPDLILLDVDMPGITGYEVCRQLKFDPQTQSIPIAFLTANAAVSDKIVGLDQGAVDYIAKPFDPFEVAARVRAAFRVTSRLELAMSNSMLDNLTGLGNRLAFEQHLQAEHARAYRSTEPLTCVIIEPDQLEELTRDEGQPELDGVLTGIAAVLKETCREEDRIFRYSNHQFAIIAPNVGAANVMTVGDRLRSAIQSHPIFRRRHGRQITASIGMAVSRFSLGHSVVDEAVEAVLQAKSSGGNAVVLGGELVELRLAV